MNVYDFDNTVYDGESAIDFFICYLRRDPSLVKYIPKIVRALIRYKRGTISIEQALGEYGRIVEDYFSTVKGLEDDVRIFWDKHIGKIKPFYYELHSDDDLIISASPEISLKDICARLGIKKYIGTAFDESGKISRFCFRENKVKAFFELYPNERIENFYTDSLNDKALIDISENAFLVKGMKITKIK
ncbi:MAG: phosphoserine phosphatase [Clostridiales bacterium]|jgi:phosphoserine phosphatase|nr:phosphoserine phosphatase [Clostridiales bacterium]